MESTPEAGEVVRHDSPISLVVSDGPEPIEIPDVVGAEESDALATLENYALDVNVVRERTMDAEKGVVFKQDPEAAAPGFRAQEMTIYVSDGPPLVEVPDVTGSNVNAARDQLEDLGFEVNVENLFGGLFGLVRSQDPVGGSEAEYGSTITIRVV